MLVSNTGPSRDGYTYCVKCGRIESATDPKPKLAGPHRKPYPDDDDKQICDGIGPTRHIVLGTDFITDIALISMRVAAPLRLQPGHSSTAVALRTVSEALAMAACQLLDIESGELMAEFRPALTPAGANGFEAEVFLYDTLPGGAGFSSQLSDRGVELFQRALRLMKTCPTAEPRRQPHRGRYRPRCREPGRSAQRQRSPPGSENRRGGRCQPAAMSRRIAASSASSGGPQNSGRVGPSWRRFSRNRKFHTSCGQTRLPTL